MTDSRNIGFELYQNLGKLFYAIAASDNLVRKHEYNKLKEIVKTEWLNVDSLADDFGTDAAYQIEIVFDWLFNEELNAKTCFDEFLTYKKENEYRFTDSIKHLIWKTANAIALAFAGKNKSELIMLAQLKTELLKNFNNEKSLQ